MTRPLGLIVLAFLQENYIILKYSGRLEERGGWTGLPVVLRVGASHVR